MRQPYGKGEATSFRRDFLQHPSLFRYSMWRLNAGVAPIYKEYWLAVELQSVEICLLVPIVFVSPCSIQKPANPQYCWPSRGDSLTAGTTWDRSN